MAREEKVTKQLINKAPGLRYVNGKRVLPDDRGVTISATELEAMMQNPAFAARVARGEFEIK